MSFVQFVKYNSRFFRKHFLSCSVSSFPFIFFCQYSVFPSRSYLQINLTWHMQEVWLVFNVCLSAPSTACDIILAYMLNSIEIFICCLNEMNDWTIPDCAKFLTLLMLATRMWMEIIFLAKVLKYRAGTHFSEQEPDHVSVQRVTLHMKIRLIH